MNKRRCLSGPGAALDRIREDRERMVRIDENVSAIRDAFIAPLKKVWILWNEFDWPQTEVQGIYTTQEAATQAMEKKNADKYAYLYSLYIEEYELDYEK